MPGNSGNKQTGISLIEALVSLLVLAILFLGIAQVLARSLVSQRYMNTQNLAVLEMRERLQQSGDATFCDNPGNLSWVGNVGLTADCQTTTVTIAVGSVSAVVNAQSVTLNTAADTVSSGLFGGDGVISVSDTP